jgi:hypothetical protein
VKGLGDLDSKADHARRVGTIADDEASDGSTWHEEKIEGVVVVRSPASPSLRRGWLLSTRHHAHDENSGDVDTLGANVIGGDGKRRGSITA